MANAAAEGHLRGLALSLNVPQVGAQQPPSSQQQQQQEADSPNDLPPQHSFEQTDDGYYYDETDDQDINRYTYTEEEADEDYNYEDEALPKNTFDSNDIEMDTIIDSTLNAAGGQDTFDAKVSGGASSGKPMIHPAVANALAQHKINGDSFELDKSSPLEDEDAFVTNENENTAGAERGDNSANNLLLTSPIMGEKQAVEESGAVFDGAPAEQGPDKNDWARSQDETDDNSGSIQSTQTNEVGLPMIKSIPQPEGLGSKIVASSEEFESIPKPEMYQQEEGAGNVHDADLDLTNESASDDKEMLVETFEPIPAPQSTGEQPDQPLDEVDDPMMSNEDTSISTKSNGSILEVGEETTFEAPEGEILMEEEKGDDVDSSIIMFPDEEERDPNIVDIEEPIGNQQEGDVDEIEGEITVDKNQDESGTIEALSQQEEEVENEVAVEEPEADGEPLNNAKNNVDIDEETTNDESGPGNFKGFDEDLSTEHVDLSKLDQPPDISEPSGITHPIVEDKTDYTGDGFTYHIFQPKGEGSRSSSILSAVVASLVALVICFCCIRLKRLRSRYSKPSRGKYSAIGSEDFFNGTFSDDISFNGKDSDDEMSYGSDDDYGNGVKIELGSIHEMESNGGLTLEEING